MTRFNIYIKEMVVMGNSPWWSLVNDEDRFEV